MFYDVNLLHLKKKKFSTKKFNLSTLNRLFSTNLPLLYFQNVP